MRNELPASADLPRPRSLHRCHARQWSLTAGLLLFWLWCAGGGCQSVPKMRCANEDGWFCRQDKRRYKYTFEVQDKMRRRNGPGNRSSWRVGISWFPSSLTVATQPAQRSAKNARQRHQSHGRRQVSRRNSLEVKFSAEENGFSIGAANPASRQVEHHATSA